MKTAVPRKFILIITLGLLLPVISFSILQLTQLTRDEARIRTIYERQLATILFSVNQDFWNEYTGWTEELRDIARRRRQVPVNTGLRRFLERTPSVSYAAIHIMNEGFEETGAAHRTGGPGRLPVEAMQRIRAELDNAAARAREGYIRPVITAFSSPDPKRASLLITPLPVPEDTSAVIAASLVIRHMDFLEQLAVPKIMEMGESDFILAVRDSMDRDRILSLSPPEQQEKRTRREPVLQPVEDPGGDLLRTFEQRAPLWLLPDLQLLIKPRGASLQQITSARRRQSLLSAVLVNLLILGGIILLLRMIYAEIALARLKTDFVANVSHELRTPLSLIRLHAETLDMKRVPDERKKHHYYRIIINESIRLTRRINAILDFSKLEAKQKRYSFSPVRLQDLISETVESCRFQLKQEGFTLTLDLDDALPPVPIDREAVMQALDNLIGNAVKYSTETRRIAICLRAEEDRAVLDVTDYGIGIPEGEQKKIFEKFYRIEGSLTQRTRGTGIGLSLVKTVMLRHGGTVSVRSRPGAGSTFSLNFPLTGREDRPGND